MTKASINLLSSGEKEVVSIEFDDEEYQIVQDYLKEMKRVRESKVIKSGLRVSVQIAASINSDVESSENIPSDDDFYVLLHLIRPFILNNEALNFGRVTNMLIRRINNSLITRLIEQYKAEYYGKSLKSIIQISVDDNVIDIDKYLEKYLNGLEYHRDPKKRNEIMQYFEYFPDNMGRALIISSIIDKANAILQIGNLISALFDANKVVEIKNA